MNKLTVLIIVSILVSGFFFLGFQEEEKPNEMSVAARLEKEVQKKLTEKRIERMQQCRTNALKIAEAKVDSILLDRAKKMTIDTIGKPIKPLKPNQPNLKTSKDSTPVKPLFDPTVDSIIKE